MKHKMLIIVSLVMGLAIGMSFFASSVPGGAVAGTTGTVTSAIQIYSPGSPTTLELDSLTVGSYYALLVGSNLATNYKQWLNFTASAATQYFIIEVDNAGFSSVNSLTVILYGALNNTDTTATVLSTYEFTLVNATKILGYDWFMTVIFPILILVVIVGVVVGLASIFAVHEYNKKRKSRYYED